MEIRPSDSDNTTDTDRQEVTRKHLVIAESSSNVDDTVVKSRSDTQPTGNTGAEAQDGSNTSTGTIALPPGDTEGNRDNSASDDTTHQFVEVTHANTNVVEGSSDRTHEQGVAEDTDVGYPEDLLLRGVGTDVGAKDVISEDGGDCNLLSGTGRGDGKEKEDKHSGGTRLAHECTRSWT